MAPGQVVGVLEVWFTQSMSGFISYSTKVVAQASKRLRGSAPGRPLPGGFGSKVRESNPVVDG